MIPLIIIGKIFIWISRLFNLGNGSTWPGEIMLRLDPGAPEKFFSRVKKGIILIAGTNGKTTTAKMVTAILAQYYSDGKTFPVIVNESGANLLNGIVSAFIGKASLMGGLQADYAVFEVDEATLPAHVRATHRSLFDGSLQGIEVQNQPAFSFQGHPEASPGPHDIAPLFSRFVLDMVTRIGRKIAVRDGVVPTGSAGATDTTGAP